MNPIAEVFWVLNGATFSHRSIGFNPLDFALALVCVGASSVRIHIIDTKTVHVWQWRKVTRRAA